MKKLTLTLVAVFFIILSVFSQTTIKMEKKGGVYVVPCKVNGLDLKFIFDTGAGDVSISLTEALFMIKNGYLSESDIIGTEYYRIANGEINEGTKILIKEIQFAGLYLYNVEASIVHNLEAPLLLGQSAISKLGKIQLDGDQLTVLSGESTSYNYASKSSNANTSSKSQSNSSGSSSSFDYSKLPTYSGQVKVFTYSPIYEKPDMVNSKQIGKAENNEVQIIRKENDKYYYVKSGTTEGYMFVGWVTKNQ
jgi:clan AA aspartic protease (TIGR02281 family)